MARIGPDWSPLQVVTTDPKCNTKLATMSFAPLIWLKILFTRWPERRNNLKILDFLRNIFILYPQRGEKGIFPYVSEQESAINAGEFFFQVCVIQDIICTLRF